MNELASTRPTSLGALPAALRVGDVAAALGISRAHAYNLVNSDGFPRLVLGRRIVVPKDAFIRWIENNTITQQGGIRRIT